jgi:hypothetical protein
MAFCSVFGIFVLLNVCIQLPSTLLRAIRSRIYGDAFWESIVATLIGVAVATGFLAVAVFFRRRLKRLEAEVGINSGE